MLIGSIALFLSVILFFVGSLPSLAMAQLQQQQTTTTTTTTTSSPSPSSSLSIITPPLTPQEQEQQNRLQNVIAATNQNLDEAEKQIGGVVFTPRWSEPVWVEPDSLAVLIAYCLPGEFAESGQEILGGFELEVLESYEIALAQGFMAWMMVIGNEDRQDRLPAAVGVVCASDLNNAQARVLSPEEQQQINNIISQFTTLQNTQITNIDQVINIINDVTTEPTTEEQPLRVEIIPNATTVFGAGFIKFDADVTGGTPPYSYAWRSYTEGSNRSFTQYFQVLGTHTILLNVTDSKNQTASDSVQITVEESPANDTEPTTEEQPLTVEIIANPTQAFAPASINFDFKVTGGTPPYNFVLFQPGVGEVAHGVGVGIGTVNGFINLPFSEDQIGTHTFSYYVTDSKGAEASDSIQITVEERPGGGLLPGIAPGEEEQPQAPPTIEEPPPTNVTGAPPPTTTEGPPNPLFG
jgi:hypothetical protein